MDANFCADFVLLGKILIRFWYKNKKTNFLKHHKVKINHTCIYILTSIKKCFFCIYFQLISTITGGKLCDNLCKLSRFVCAPASGIIYPAAALSSPVVSSNDMSLYWAAPSGKQSWVTEMKNTLSSLFLKPLKCLAWNRSAGAGVWCVVGSGTAVSPLSAPKQIAADTNLTERLQSFNGRRDHATPASSSSHRLPVNFSADVKSTFWPGWLPRSASVEGCVEFSPSRGPQAAPERPGATVLHLSGAPRGSERPAWGEQGCFVFRDVTSNSRFKTNTFIARFCCGASVNVMIPRGWIRAVSQRDVLRLRSNSNSNLKWFSSDAFLNGVIYNM